jgi:outer membrane protein assembly factor BamB
VVRSSDRLLVLVPSYDRNLYALDARSGEVAWRAKARGGFFSSPAVVPGSTPTIVALAWDHELHGIDGTTGEERFAWFSGRPLWDVSGLDASTWSSPIAARINGEVVIFSGSYDGKLRALPLDASGSLAPAQRSALLFWLSFPATIVPLVLLALWLTKRHRQRAATAAT